MKISALGQETSGKYVCFLLNSTLPLQWFPLSNLYGIKLPGDVLVGFHVKLSPKLKNLYNESFSTKPCWWSFLFYVYLPKEQSNINSNFSSKVKHLMFQKTVFIKEHSRKEQWIKSSIQFYSLHPWFTFVMVSLVSFNKQEFITEESWKQIWVLSNSCQVEMNMKD